MIWATSWIHSTINFFKQISVFSIYENPNETKILERLDSENGLRNFFRRANNSLEVLSHKNSQMLFTQLCQRKQTKLEKPLNLLFLKVSSFNFFLFFFAFSGRKRPTASEVLCLIFSSVEKSNRHLSRFT